MERTRVFVDTNVILEAFRTGCWTALCTHFAVETVEKCVTEALSGNPADSGHIPVDPTVLRRGLTACHAATRHEIATLALHHPHSRGLDDGELHLLAWLYARGIEPEEQILISTADKAAIVAASKLGWLDSVVCLGELVEEAGLKPSRLALAKHHCGEWLATLKTRIRLGTFP